MEAVAGPSEPDPRRDTAQPDNLPEVEEVDPEASELIKASVADALGRSNVNLPTRQKEKLEAELTRSVTMSVQASFSGPIPPPGMLHHYESVLPGLGRDIVEMAKKEQEHRHSWEQKALINDVFMQSGALILGWILAAAAFAISAFFFYHKEYYGGGVFMTVPVFVLIRTIITAGKKDKVPPAAKQRRTSSAPNRSQRRAAQRGQK
ncbi:DUF2335 domain-containing protein [Pseudoroseomonas wenyumeiae]|uniref:DUF2335 domain-containing protein n=2 Tax=Teichococcus wenyumeiae TaxID=2478470 RepID=A0A3A9JFS4_9PROT|nr:DUF2335 domain-containing protein [Pseudoroseomonas wenyumeiae]RMI20396.1 DUF2335 domain-containing protein [Pseudoroseomonas wenyumeiae]